MGVVDNFFKKVNKTDTCWLWTGAVSGGYGKMNDGRGIHRVIYVHRLAWEIYNSKPIPSNKQVMHLCDVRNCVNPRHLQLGTHNDNVRDMINKGRQAKGENNGATSISNIEAEEIRQSKERQCLIARKYRVTQQTVSNIKSGKTHGTR